MIPVMRNLIQYFGVEKCNYTLGNFKQINVDNTFCIPVVKPDIEQIVKVWSEAKICKHKIIKTPIGKSYEGQKLTGYKLVIMGEIKMKYEYVALNETQTVHTAHNNIPFCGYIVLPERFNPSTIVFPTVAIEDIHADQCGIRSIYSNVTMLLNVELC